MSDTPISAISLCVISGAPGSGKTTLLTATEKAERRLGRRPVVIVQALGEAATDAHWLRANGAAVIEVADEPDLLSSWGRAFGEALRLDPDAIFVETVAPSGALADAAAGTGLAARFVTVVDVLTDPAPVPNGANPVVFAKADRLAPDALANLQVRWIQLAPETVPFIGRNGRITGGDWWRNDDASDAGTVAPEFPLLELTGFALPASRSLMREPFEKFLAGLPDGVVTAKGFVDFVDEGGTWGVRRENGTTLIRPVDTKFPVFKHLGLVVRADAAPDRAALASALAACEAGRRRLVVL